MRINELQLHGTKWINFSNIMGARQPEMKVIIPFIKILVFLVGGKNISVSP